mgnify:CR=1 FL=1
MAKLTKRAEVLDQLHRLVEKEAAQAQTNISGKPGVDTKITSVSEKTEHTDKNNVGPEHLNDEQGYKQEKETDASTPVAKTATDISKVADEILSNIKEKLALAQTDISGVPCKDTNVSSIAESTEHTDKNNIGPDKLNNEQGYKQEAAPAKDQGVIGHDKVSAEAEKQASYNLGFAFVEALSKRAEAIGLARQKQAEAEMIKEAGRRDLETLIAQAAAELDGNEKQAAYAEQQGAQAFDELYKQAQLEAAVEENKLLKQKVAQLQEFEKTASEKTAEEVENQRLAKLASVVAEQVTNALKSALVKA